MANGRSSETQEAGKGKRRQRGRARNGQGTGRYQQARKRYEARLIIDGKPKSVYAKSEQEAIDVLSKRHAMTIIWLLQQEEPRRFNEIKRELNINPVSLSQRLTELEEAGVLERKTYNEAPPRVEYKLTAKGRDLVPLMDSLGKWARRHRALEATA